jgi:hypothetical protein
MNILASWFTFIPTSMNQFMSMAGMDPGKAGRSSFLKMAEWLEGQKLKDFQTLVEAKADDIVRRWIDFFVHNLRSKPEVINRRLK